MAGIGFRTGASVIGSEVQIAELNGHCSVRQKI
jgi:hypothetical protein